MGSGIKVLDGAVMDQQYIDDNHIVDRYLLGQLSEDEASAFEAYYFEHPKMLEELKIAQAMQETLREQRSSLESVDVQTVTTSWLERLFPPKLGFAFSLALSVVVIGLLMQNVELNSGAVDVYPVSSLSLSSSRGSGADVPSIRFGHDQTAAVLRLEVGQIGYEDVILRLRRESGDLIWDGRANIDGPIGTIDLVISAENLTSDHYEIAVFPPQGGDVPLSTYAFEVL